MLGKPFRPPLLKKLPDKAQSDSSPCPPAKRRCISISDDEQFEIPKSTSTFPSSSVSIQSHTGLQKPLLALRNDVAASTEPKASCNGVEGYYTVLW